MRCRLLCAEHRTRPSSFEARCCPAGVSPPARAGVPCGRQPRSEQAKPIQRAQNFKPFGGSHGQWARNSCAFFACRRSWGATATKPWSHCPLGAGSSTRPANLTRDHRNSQPASWRVGGSSCPACPALSESLRSPVPKPDFAVKVTRWELAELHARVAGVVGAHSSDH